METVVKLDDEVLSRIGHRIDAAWKRVTVSEQEWIEGSLELAQALAEARGRFKSDNAFGAWLKSDGHNHVNKNDRAALIGLAGDLVLARKVLTETTRRSYQYIWNEVAERFPYTRKPTRSKTTRTRISREAQSAAAKKAKDEGLTQKDAAQATGTGSVQSIKQGTAYNEGWNACLNSLLDAAGAKNFSEKGQLRIEDAIRIHKDRLTRAFEQQVNEEVRRRIIAADDAARKHNKQLSEENLRLSFQINRLTQRGVFTDSQFAKLMMCVHPDNSASESVRREMQTFLNDKNIRLRLIKS